MTAADPVAPDGHLRPAWLSGGWADWPDRIARWAGLALADGGTPARGAGRPGRPAMALPTARAEESTAELLCAELSADGLPMDRAVAEPPRRPP